MRRTLLPLLLLLPIALAAPGRASAGAPAVLDGAPDQEVALDPTAWRRVAEGLPGYEEYRRRRLVLAVRDGQLIGPHHLGYSRRAFRQDNASGFYVVVEGEADYRLTYPDLLRLSGDPVIVARYERFVTAAQRDQTHGAALFGVGVGFAVASLVATSVAFDEGDFSWSPVALPPLIGASASFMLIGAGVSAKARETEHTLAEDYRLERILDRDEAWAAVQRYNAALRRDLGLPDDERMDARRDAD